VSTVCVNMRVSKNYQDWVGVFRDFQDKALLFTSHVSSSAIASILRPLPLPLSGFRSKWIDLRQAKTEIINGPFYTNNVEYISPTEMLCFVIISNYSGEPRVAKAATLPCTNS